MGLINKKMTLCLFQFVENEDTLLRATRLVFFVFKKIKESLEQISVIFSQTA